jgi:alcohol dehydrogenase class IV
MDLDETNQNVVLGYDECGQYLTRMLSGKGIDRILMVSGRKSYEASGAKEFLEQAPGVEVATVFSDFDVNPDYEDVQRGLDTFRKVSPDCLLAVGGGSVLDMAKLIRFFGASNIPLSTDLQRLPENLHCKSVPLLAIPTTAGTGSEATCFSVLYKKKIKYSVEHPAMLPDAALLIPQLTESQSPYQTACSGYDALAQAIESYWAVGATPESKAWAAAALGLCVDHLENVVRNPSFESREGMLLAAHWAGRAINISRTTAAHALSYTLTAHYGLPHGHALAMLLPIVFKLNANAGTDDILNGSLNRKRLNQTIKELCRFMHCDSANDALNYVQRLSELLGLTGRWLVDGHHDVASVRSHIVDDVNVERLANNPLRLDRKHLCRIADQFGAE